MFINAKCREDNTPCVLNTDYIVDIIYSKCQWVGYTIDRECEGYIIEPTDIERLKETE